MMGECLEEEFTYSPVIVEQHLLHTRYARMRYRHIKVISEKRMKESKRSLHRRNLASSRFPKCVSMLQSKGRIAI